LQTSGTPFLAVPPSVDREITRLVVSADPAHLPDWARLPARWWWGGGSGPARGRLKKI